MVVRVRNVVAYCDSQAGHGVTKAGVNLASLLGVKDPEVSLACHSLTFVHFATTPSE